MKKQDWVVTISITETEGVDTPNPWYQPQDIEALIRGVFNRSTPLRDLEIKKVNAIPDGREY